MRSIVDLVTDLRSRQQPTLTWYGPEDERVDLTGKVTANWIIKATNLLAIELACEPGSKVWLDLPAHWRSLIWAHAAWCAGAEVSLDPSDADIAITAAPTEAHSHLETVVIALPALARRVDSLPAGAIDGAADLMTQADDFMLAPEGSAGAETGLEVTQGDLLTQDDPAGRAGTRTLLGAQTLPELLLRVPPVWAAGGSVVVLAQDDADGSIAAAEGVTHT